MKKSGCDQKITIQKRIGICHVITETCHSKGVLHQSADKSMMYGLGCGMSFKHFHKFLIFHKKLLQKLGKIRILHTVDQVAQLALHIVHTVLTGRKIICRIILPFSCLACSLNVQLHGTCKTCHISHDLNVIQGIKIIDPQRIWVPDLTIDHTCFILKDQILIGFSILRCSCLFLFTEIDSVYSVSLM